MPVLLEVVVHPRALNDSRIFRRLPRLLLGLDLVPVEDPARERTDEPRAALGSRYCLHHAEDQGKIAVDPFLLQLLCCQDPLPRCCQLDEDARLWHALLLVHLDNPASTAQALLHVEAEPRINLCAHVALDELGDLLAQVYGKTIHGELDDFATLSLSSLLLCVSDGLVNKRDVGGVTTETGLTDEERVRRGVGDVAGGCKLLDKVQVPSVHGQSRHACQLRKLILSSLVRRHLERSQHPSTAQTRCRNGAWSERDCGGRPSRGSALRTHRAETCRNLRRGA
mmetsp:Transcript_23929/g.53621  ORF Transcript_23929/g.53621 Transcript_23929/m.53621 type:complete len:282 (+) Transcript_23929:81-926(+)